ncbi:alpha/beta hydrolase [Rhodococcus spongiicola]|uniref:Alpha/beta hydrolase n=1 Tax=Rhodococcus spongiicola TaxID=2487352 RepID=A0A438B116_9NOCA|nr:alpha/beta hydrolase [Rhodococcus spongiicola]RVW04656.1 alpha/beta hydrolase [Rhodococcus spongiicola]
MGLREQAGCRATDPSLTVLVLPGGKVTDRRRTRPWQVADLRMWAFTWTLRRLGRGIDVRQVRYRLRGWNGDERSPVHDVRRILDELQPSGVPVVLIGHSMGGRVAAVVADDPQVVALLALAPWWSDGEGARIPTATRMVVVHGTADRVTDPLASRMQTELAAARGVPAHWIGVAGAGHAMLRSPWRWRRIAVDFVRDQSHRASSPNVS